MKEQACLVELEYFLPDRVVTNEQLAARFPEWSVDKIEAKTGIRQRHIAGPDECASDLGIRAAERLFEQSGIQRDEIDFLLFCTESPDYFFPASACIIQSELGLDRDIGAFDITLGCSGFVVGLSQAKALIESDLASNVLLICADTYSKFMHPEDKSVQTIFGDGGSAALIGARQGNSLPFLDSFVFGTDGRGAENLIVPMGGCRRPIRDGDGLDLVADKHGNARTERNLFMNGAEIFAFTIDIVPKTVSAVLKKSGLSIGEIDKFVFHQANKFMLGHLQRKLEVPDEKFVYCLSDCGNTVSSTIPIAIKREMEGGRVNSGDVLLLLGFGVGYSWAGSILRVA